MTERGADRRLADRGTPDRRRGRPALTSDEKLVPAKVSLSPACFDALSREATRRQVPLAHILRERIDPYFREPKNHACL